MQWLVINNKIYTCKNQTLTVVNESVTRKRTSMLYHALYLFIQLNIINISCVGQMSKGKKVRIDN